MCGLRALSDTARSFSTGILSFLRIADDGFVVGRHELTREINLRVSRLLHEIAQLTQSAVRDQYGYYVTRCRINELIR